MRRLVGLLALTLVAGVVGVGVTSVWPTRVTTNAYAATLRLSAEPDQLSTLHAPTLFGDLDLRFGGWLPAPGVTANAQVRERITSVLATKNLSVAALKPSASEIDSATTSAVTQLGVKYAVGALVTCALVALALRHWRGRTAGPRPWRRAVGIPALALVLALGGTGLSSWTTFRPDRLQSVGADGLLGYVRSNTRMLSDVEARSAQAEPYVKNMLALSAALQDKFVPASLASPASVKLLLVSDIHGANAYPLMRQIVQTEGITAVVDSGDLVNFGRPQEVDAAGLAAGIQSLGVPYLFVRGNHDASSPTDDAITRRLATIPNVVVLEPSRGRYTLATVGGLHVAGFGDPRWFGDGGDPGAASQTAPAERFERALSQLRDGTATATAPTTVAGPTATPQGGTTTATGTASPSGTPSPGTSTSATSAASAAAEADLRRGLDLLVTHEPYAAERVSDASLRVNGHMHTAALQGNRIQVGTFTGGGVVSRYEQEASGGELEGQPYAFDVLSFGGDCRLQTLTRYSYRDLLEGHPVYDDVRAINGSTVQSPLPSAGRTCSATDPVTVRSFAATSDPSPSGDTTTTP